MDTSKTFDIVERLAIILKILRLAVEATFAAALDAYDKVLVTVATVASDAPLSVPTTIKSKISSSRIYYLNDPTSNLRCCGSKHIIEAIRYF